MSSELFLHMFAILAFTEALSLRLVAPGRFHWLVCAAAIALATLLLLLATAWRGIWREQELWIVGAVFAFAELFFAALLGTGVASLARRLGHG